MLSPVEKEPTASLLPWLGAWVRSRSATLREGWITAPHALIAKKRPDLLPPGAADDEAFVFYRRGLPPRDAFQAVQIVAHRGSSGLPPLVAAASLAMRESPPSEPAAATILDLQGFERGCAAEGWRLLLGPRITRQPQWVRATEARCFVESLARTFGAERVLAIAWEIEGGGNGVALGIVSLVSSMSACWELTRPLTRAQGRAHIRATGPPLEGLRVGGRVEVNFGGTLVGGTIQALEGGAGTVQVDSVGIVSNIPLGSLRRRIAAPGSRGVLAMTDAEFCQCFAGISTVVVDAVETSGPAGKLDDVRNDAPLEAQDDSDDGSEDSDNEAMSIRSTVLDDAGVDISYAQICEDGQWIELGRVTIDFTAASASGGDASLSIVCAFSLLDLVKTPISTGMSMVQRGRTVSWLAPSPREIGGSLILSVCQFQSIKAADSIIKFVSGALGILPVTEFSGAEDPIVVLPEATRKPGSAQLMDPTSPDIQPLKTERPVKLVRRASKVVLSCSAFNEAGAALSERDGLVLLARARGLTESVAPFLQMNDLCGAKKMLYERSSHISDDTKGIQKVVLSRRRTALASRISVASRGTDDSKLRALHHEDLALEVEAFARGGGGEVFRGTLKGSTIVAKSMLAGNLEDDFELANELMILACLSHPNIINVMGICEHDGRMLLIEEYADGGDLSTLIHSEAYTPVLFSKVGVELLSAVAYMHKGGFSHLDLKLQNVLIHNDKYQRPTVKLADFGTSSSGSSACSSEQRNKGSFPNIISSPRRTLHLLFSYCRSTDTASLLPFLLNRHTPLHAAGEHAGRC